MNSTIDQHLTDDQIYRAVDQHLDSDESEGVQSHLESCTVCRDAVVQAQLRTQRLSDLLRRTDYQTPSMRAPATSPRVVSLETFRARRMPQWLRMAATIAILMGGLFAIPQVRAAIVEWAQTVWTRITPRAEPTTVAPRSVQPQPVLGPRVQFTVTAATLYLEFDRTDDSGVLDLRRGNDDVVIAEADRANVDLVVLTDRLRVINSREQGVRYAVVVPPHVRNVVVRVNGRERARVGGSQLSPDGIQLRIR